MKGRPITPELVSVYCLWNIVLTQEADKEGLGGLSIAVPLKDNVQHDAMFINRPEVPPKTCPGQDGASGGREVPPKTCPGQDGASDGREVPPKTCPGQDGASGGRRVGAILAPNALGARFPSEECGLKSL